jgi:hypothetical protein
VVCSACVVVRSQCISNGRAGQTPRMSNPFAQKAKTVRSSAAGDALRLSEPSTRLGLRRIPRPFRMPRAHRMLEARSGNSFCIAFLVIESRRDRSA